VRAQWRKITKNGVFGNLYRVEAPTLSNTLRIPLEESKKLLKDLRALYAGVEAYYHDYVKWMHAHGYSETLFGFKRLLPNLTSKRDHFVSEAERQGWNLLIQGTAAQITKIAMIRLWNAFNRYKLNTKIVLQVHDELVFEVAAGEGEQLAELVRREMSGAHPLSVPLDVSTGTGPDWQSATH
jgi:DNA polymerase I